MRDLGFSFQLLVLSAGVYWCPATLCSSPATFANLARFVSSRFLQPIRPPALTSVLPRRRQRKCPERTRPSLGSRIRSRAGKRSLPARMLTCSPASFTAREQSRRRGTVVRKSLREPRLEGNSVLCLERKSCFPCRKFDLHARVSSLSNFQISRCPHAGRNVNVLNSFHFASPNTFSSVGRLDG